MVKTPIVKEGYIFIAILGVITIAVGILLGPYWSIIPGCFWAFSMYFFRNPPRNVIKDDALILSPADGTVMSITDVYDEDFIGGEGTKVSIFLSVFDVHINRSPISGEIKYQQYTCGRFKPAYKEVAPFENERHTIGIENAHIKLLVIQIAGILARRIVSWVTLGSYIEQGQRYGMIKFGSCTEVIVPKNVEILVKKGDKVKGGLTIIGRLTR